MCPDESYRICRASWHSAYGNYSGHPSHFHTPPAGYSHLQRYFNICLFSNTGSKNVMRTKNSTCFLGCIFDSKQFIQFHICTLKFWVRDLSRYRHYAIKNLTKTKWSLPSANSLSHAQYAVAATKGVLCHNNWDMIYTNYSTNAHDLNLLAKI